MDLPLSNYAFVLVNHSFHGVTQDFESGCQLNPGCARYGTSISDVSPPPLLTYFNCYSFGVRFHAVAILICCLSGKIKHQY